MKKLQHNKTIVVNGPKLNIVVCGSTNFTWRGLYVQNNNALVLTGKEAPTPFSRRSSRTWRNGSTCVRQSARRRWKPLGLDGIDALVASRRTARPMRGWARSRPTSRTREPSVFYSPRSWTRPRPFREAIHKVTEDEAVFVYGIADGESAARHPHAGRQPEPLAPLPSCRRPAAVRQEPRRERRPPPPQVRRDRLRPADGRVYLGSYNFSDPADLDNGENLLLFETAGSPSPT